MSNLVKEKKVKSFSGVIKDKSLVFVDYKGVNVESLEALRGELREDGSVIKVFKNTLTKRALSDLSMDFDEKLFVGMVATTIIDDDKFINSSKSILKAEKEEKLKIKGGFFEGKKIDSDEVRKFASLLSKEDLYGVLVGCMQGIVSNLVYVLDDIKGEKEKNDGGAKTEEPKAEEPKTEEPKAEEPKAEDEQTEEAKTEAGESVKFEKK